MYRHNLVPRVLSYPSLERERGREGEGGRGREREGERERERERWTGRRENLGTRLI